MTPRFRPLIPLRIGVATALIVATTAIAAAPPPSAPSTPPKPAADAALAIPPGTAGVRAQAAVLKPFATTALGTAFLDATALLPEIEERVVWRSKDKSRALTDSAFQALPETERAVFEARPCSPTFYWNTGYGSPLVYLRVVDLLAKYGCTDVAGRKLADFGCGQIGSLRLLASLGAEAHGIDVEPLLGALYGSPGDTGRIAGRAGRDGSVALHIGRWPAEPAITTAVGGEYDAIVSKNTLKRGYIHPDREVDPKFLVHLGVDDATFLNAVHGALKPGGIFLIYNICPAQNPPDKPFLPHADGRSPWDRATLEKAGFEVLAFDENDIDSLLPIWRALGYHDGADDAALRTSLFVSYTVLRKR